MFIGRSIFSIPLYVTYLHLFISLAHKLSSSGWGPKHRGSKHSAKCASQLLKHLTMKILFQIQVFPNPVGVAVEARSFRLPRIRRPNRGRVQVWPTHYNSEKSAIRDETPISIFLVLLLSIFINFKTRLMNIR